MATCRKNLLTESSILFTMTQLFRFPLILALTSVMFLAACESDEEKAARHLQSGLALLEEGDIDRALVELRNVFKYDGFNKEARQLYADTVLEQGRTQEAYSQYLRLIEQYPDTWVVRQALAELAIARGDWDEARRHGNAAIELSPDTPDVQAIGIALAYRDAVLDRADAFRATLADEAQTLLNEIRSETGQDNDLLVRILIDHLISREQPQDALAVVEDALSLSPEAEDLNMLKARLLAQIGDSEGTGQQLQKMVELFPENRDIQQALLNWYLVEQDLDGAEAFLRRLAGPDTGPAEGHVEVIRFLEAGRGSGAARAELERLIAANEDTQTGILYRGMLASMTFQAGEPEAGIADMRATLEDAEPSEETRRLQVILARMLEATQADDEARALIETVLEQDASNVEALKMQASWLIDDDRPGDAIVALRSALNQSPQDTETLTLMARAHERDGDIELMGERLSLAVEVSNSAPEESLRYARFLIGQDRLSVAATVLEDARRRTPNNLDVLRLLADIHLQTQDWALAQTLVEQMRNLGIPESQQLAIELQARILQGQDRTEDSLTILEAQIGDNIGSDDSRSARAVALVVQAQLLRGNVEAARTAINDALAEAPDNPQLRLVDASLYAITGNVEAATAGYRDLIDQFPNSVLPVRLLMSLLVANERLDEAEALLNAALGRMPDQPTLLWMKAGDLEQDGDIESAIDVYEQLYAQDSGNVVIANNLASMLSTHRASEEDLERATVISRRLRGTEVPAFQDTYGWIAYRRADYDEAIRYLEPAAAALTGNPLVQYHLGMTYAALGRVENAKEALTRSLQIAGDSPLPQFEIARETLAKFDTDANAATE